jgi:hypothetical protein
MPDQNSPDGNGHDTSDSPVGTKAKGDGDSTPETNRRRARAGESPRPKARSAPRESALNAIQASRKPKRDRVAPEAPAAAEGAGAPSAGSPAAASPLRRADSDPWTVPQSVRDRFVQDGHRFFFPDGAPAFRDLGRKLTTVSENTQVVHSLVEIARSRGWSEVTVTGTERFRQEAWRQARLAGLEVKGYRPSDEQRAQLVRAMGRSLVRPVTQDSISTEAGVPTPPVRENAREATATEERGRERIAGKLLDHGPDNYLHDPNQEGSYFVRLGVPGGYREVWGKDIGRAISKSLTQPQIGDEVILQRTGRDPVTVKRDVRGEDGRVTPRDVAVFRSRWVIEKQDFLQARAEAAQLVRDETIGAREAVRRHPELAGTYLNLRAAELSSRALRDPEDQRRFVTQVRGALADGVERGEPLQPVRLRGPRPSRAEKAAEPLTRE